ncbi:DNA-binding transcriptional LysR family regulator [Shimia isoporae]|uniref:DNA-binding transcriptional LysR family regulator n=1 Tax=Shimia isoporae TaxID=647720 RepID=A0A4R1N4I4_9RHOB|nr:LysR family transcriptional regulator [Shimia isoporae]TCL01505.1 DNA-binding transcriptional LysR family regulator [Shimia isoporae]
MAQINLKQLETFVQVADLGGFRRAAERLNTTQPNVSARIAALEAQLGRKLMDRDAGSVRLTPFGESMLDKARQVLAAMDDFVSGAGDDALFDGVLRLGVTEMIAHSWLVPYLSGLKERFPNIDVDLTVDLSANLSEALFDRSLDLALQSGPFGRTSATALPLGSFPYIWVGAPVLDIGRRVLNWPELARFPILTHARGTLPFEQIQDHVEGFPDVSARIVPSTNMSACIQMTIEGLGVACLPESMVRQELATGKLEALRYLWCPDALRFFARFEDTAPHFVREAADLASEISWADLGVIRE